MTTTPALPAHIPSFTPALGGQAGGPAGRPVVYVDNAHQGLVNVLLAETARNNITTGQIRHARNGRVQLVFTLRDGSRYPRVSRVRQAADWMRDNRVLDRQAFFDDCPFSCRSADVHSKALRLLAEFDKVIVKDHGYWVWKD